MRMFLVGMCDIFLLLYLTAAGQVAPNAGTRVTLEDYEHLEQEHRDARSAMKSREEALAQSNAELERARHEQDLLREALRRSQEQLSAAAWGRTIERAALSERLDEASKSADVLAAQASEAERRSEQLSAEIAATRAEAASLAAERAQYEAQSNALALAAERSRADAAALELRTRQRERELQSAQQELQQRLAAAQSALAEARRSAERADSAARTAGVEKMLARGAEERALEDARRAFERADEAEARAALARAQAEEAQTRAAAEQQRLRSILQPAEQAYEAKVEARLLSISASVQRRAFLGTAEHESRLWGLPVRTSGGIAVFQPAAQLGVSGDQRPEEFTEVRFEVRGRTVRELLAHPSKPGLVGLSIENFDAAASEPLDGSLLMPVLLAVRNGAESGFADSIRDLNTHYYLFQRDRLRVLAGGTFVLDARGIRGTGDFGESILPGDQISDLEGQLLGVALERNAITPIGSLHEWRRIPVQGRNAAVIVRALRDTWRE